MSENSRQPHSTNESDPFPTPEPTTPFWRTEPDVIDEHRSTDTLPNNCDILIIGAGLSGASAAYYLLNDDVSPPPSVVVLEARQVCSGATGRNGGHIKLAWREISRIANEHGDEYAAEIARYHLDQIQAMKGVIEKEKIDCDFYLRRSYDVFLDETKAQEVKIALDKQLEDGVESSEHVDFVGPKYAEHASAYASQLTGVKGAKAALSVPACSLWPYKLVTALFKIALSKGLNLQTNTCVTSVSPTPDHDGYHEINTHRGSVKARKVLFATNGYTAGITPSYSQKIIPWRGINSRLVVGEGKEAPNLSNTYNNNYINGSTDYINPRPDGSIIVGGGRACYGYDKEQYYGNYDDSTLIESARNYFDGYMQRHFKDYKDSDARTDMVWTGIMGNTIDLLPHIGAVPGHPGQYIMAGFNGMGMLHIFLSGKGMAKIILHGVEFEETGIPRLFKTTQERLDSTENKILPTYGDMTPEKE